MVSTKRKWQIWDELTEALIPALAGLSEEELHWFINETQGDGWLKMVAGDVLNLPDEVKAKLNATANAQANVDDLQCVGCGIKPEDWTHEPVFRMCKDGIRCVNCMRLEDGVGSVALDTQPTKTTKTRRGR